MPDNPYKAIFAVAALVALLVWLASGRRAPWYIHATAAVLACGGAALAAWLWSAGMAWSDLWVVALVTVLGAPLAAYGGYALHELTTADTAAAPADASFTKEETELASRLGVYSITAYGVSPSGWPDSALETAGFALTRDEAAARSNAVELKPGWEECRIHGPRPLLELLRGGSIEMPHAQALLARARAGEPHELLEPPLTEEEMRRAEAISVHTVYYEDRFHYGGGRESSEVAVAFTREQAEREAERRGLLPESGGDGHAVSGPSPLAGKPSRALVREMLARHARGETGILEIDSRYR